MCQLTYIQCRDCHCQYFAKAPSYCDTILTHYNRYSGGPPKHKPRILVKGDEGSFRYQFNYEITFETADVFRPIERITCYHITYLKEDVEKDCLWHKADWTADLRAERKKKFEEERKRKTTEREAAALRRVKQWAREVIA